MVGDIDTLRPLCDECFSDGETDAGRSIGSDSHVTQKLDSHSSIPFKVKNTWGCERSTTASPVARVRRAVFTITLIKNHLVPN